MLFLISVLTHIGLFYSKFDNLKHGSSHKYASCAVGLYKGQGITISRSEILKMDNFSNNNGNYLTIYDSENRNKFIEFLPGPGILLSLLWKVIPIYNASPYIWLQIIIHSLLISLFYLIFNIKDHIIVLFTTIFMIFNFVSVSKTLFLGYDFWPQFDVLLSFICIYMGIKNKNTYLLLATGILTGITIWFRSITTFLPFFIALFICIYYKFFQNVKSKLIIYQITLYLLPILFILISLSLFRYNQTGNFRPTRSIFWPTFFAGVGQYANPYGIMSNDHSIMEYAESINSKFKNYTAEDKYLSPVFDKTMKDQSILFIKNYPQLFIRNSALRIIRMISPPLNIGNTKLIPNKIKQLVYPLGYLLFLLWFFGLYYHYKNEKLKFFLISTIYLYFFSFFSWFYVIGRVILPFLFINIYIYLSGIKQIYKTCNGQLKFNNSLNN